MILKSNIKDLLNQLEDFYNDEPHPRSTYYSKLAVIELCGWIEDSLDLIAERCVKNKIKTNKYIQIKDSTIRNNYGFDYKSLRKMLLQTIGIVSMEELEKDLEDDGLFNILESTLETLKIQRNKAAHTTNASGVMFTFQSPSVTRNQLEILYPILRKMYSFTVRYNP